MSFYSKLPFAFFLSFFTLVSLAGDSHADFWKQKDVLQRDQGPSSASCDFFDKNPKTIFLEYGNSKDLRKDFREHTSTIKDSQTAESRLRKSAKAEGRADPTRCYLQKHKGEFKNSEYHLAFLEFKGNGILRKPKQFQDLKLHLEKHNKHVVLVYVHGWRYDANVGNQDVRRFNMMLGYTRRNMQYRCQSKGRYCDHKLTGIYIGWPGRTWADNCGFICKPGLALSLRGRKRTSEKIAPKVFEHLQKIETQLQSRQTFNKKPWNRNVFVSMGHSLGGNLLANAVKGAVIAEIDSHQPGTKIQGPLGDLVVLFNPASDAQNWIDVQKKVRQKNGIESSPLNLGNDAQATKVHQRFPDSQPPVYIAISAPCSPARYKEKSEKNKHFNKENCDRAVAELFQINQVIRSGKIRDRNRIAIGHYEPDGTCKVGSDPAKLGCPTEPKKGLEYYGVTHEMGVQCSRSRHGELCNTPASLYHALSGEVELGSKDDVAACAVGDGWLYNARVWQKPRVFLGNKISTTKWNSGMSQNGEALYNSGKTINRLHPTRPIYGQFSHSIYRQNGRFDITSGNDPFWNVRASSASVVNHGGFSNVKLLCSVNQMFLDQIAQPM